MPYTRTPKSTSSFVNDLWTGLKQGFESSPIKYLKPLLSAPKRGVDLAAAHYSGLPMGNEPTTEDLISESLFPRENEEENLASKAFKLAFPGGGVLLDNPIIEPAARAMSRIPAAVATDPMTPLLGGAGKLGNALLGGYFGTQAAEEGGKQLGEGVAELDKDQGLSPTAIEKLVGGVGQLGFSGVALRSPVKGTLSPLNKDPFFQQKVTGIGTEKGSFEFGDPKKPVQKLGGVSKQEKLFDQSDIDRRALELVDQGYKPERAIRIAKAEFEEIDGSQSSSIPMTETLTPPPIKPPKPPIVKSAPLPNPSPIKSLDNPIEKSFIDDLTDLPKTLRGSLDISFPLRQGLFFLNRPEALKGIVKGTKSISEKSHLNTQAELAARPNASLYEASGLQLTKYDPTTLAEKSEQLPSRLAEKLPGVKQSQRVFIDQGNLTMANMFDKFANDFQKAGKTFETHPEAYQGMAKYINVLTGRDTLPKKLQQASTIMNKAFWSPRFVKSRLNMLNPAFYMNLPPEIQKAAIRDVGGTLATLTTALTAAAYAAKQAGVDDVSVESDPTHTNFGKLKVGKTTYDFFSGLTPVIRTLSRVATGQIKTPRGAYKLSGMTGRSLLGMDAPALPGAPFGRSSVDEVLGFAEGKMSPLIGATKSRIKGTGFGGEKYGNEEFARDTLAPMALTSFIENYKRYGYEEALKALPDFLGVSTNTELPESEKGNLYNKSNRSRMKKKSKSKEYKFAY